MAQDDFEFLRRLYATTRTDIALSALPDATKQALLEHQFQAQHDDYQSRFSRANFDIVLADKEPAGRAYVSYSTAEIRVIDISILPEYQNQGIGKRIMNDVIYRAKREGVPVRLRVQKDNPALQLYQQLGFQVIEDEHIVWHMELQSENEQQKH